MLKTLRSRLMLSHTLPLLIIIPLMGIALIYILENQVMQPGLIRGLTSDAQLLAQITLTEPEVWDQPGEVENLLDRVGGVPNARIMLLSPSGQVLAVNREIDTGLIGETLLVPNKAGLSAGQVVSNIGYRADLDADVIDIWAPARSPEGELIGLVRMSSSYLTVYDEIIQARYLIAGILLGGMLVGALIGFILALNISSPVRQVSRAIFLLARGDRHDPLPVQGAEEIQTLLQAVNTLLERLHNLEAARKQLLANLVHELGRPLGALRSAIQALQSGAGEDQALLEDLLAGMDDEAARLQNLLNDLAHLHDQILGQLELERIELDLVRWLPKTLAPWEAAARAKDLEWELDLPLRVPPLAADPNRLGQAIGNLASNAIKFTPSGGKVTVSAGSHENQVWIRVSDTGPGIPAGEQEKIFDPFFRGADSGRRFPQGMGLGLSIARDVVAAHAGRMEIDSQPGEGSRFTIWLPVSMEALPPPAAIIPSKETTPWGI